MAVLPARRGSPSRLLREALEGLAPILPPHRIRRFSSELAIADWPLRESRLRPSAERRPGPEADGRYAKRQGTRARCIGRGCCHGTGKSGSHAGGRLHPARRGIRPGRGGGTDAREGTGVAAGPAGGAGVSLRPGPRVRCQGQVRRRPALLRAAAERRRFRSRRGLLPSLHRPAPGTAGGLRRRDRLVPEGLSPAPGQRRHLVPAAQQPGLLPESLRAAPGGGGPVPEGHCHRPPAPQCPQEPRHRPGRPGQLQRRRPRVPGRGQGPARRLLRRLAEEHPEVAGRGQLAN
jgi:hypothetical protein